ncbi:MAG: hypothetical protein V2J55_13210 [Candidatus Competibacteraceae bacterium]|jgi:hypothetical protein|nr:hypothetical protein [Candidatus Competibacteraceae bacterium]
MNVTLHNPDFDGFNIEFWQAAFLALENYLADPTEPEGYQHSVDFDLEVGSDVEVKLKIWREQAGQVHIQCLSTVNTAKHCAPANADFDKAVGCDF